MKKMFFRGCAIAALAICSFATTVFAQQQMPPIPIDPNVRIGKLDNGLTYYIRKNNLPENRADFYIAQKVGSILEEPHQRGLAHFLEHMSFNGTKNFPGNDKGLGIIPWCESVGIKFGRNLNAYTSIDETVYNISNAPMTREGILDSCLLILHDWSNHLLLTGEEIDKERGVIHEEWRTRQNASMRMIERALPQIYGKDKYSDCLPIGTMDVVDNFEYEALRSYYRKWYRPDLQGIVIVGDIDVDKVEAKIKKMFADIAKPVNPAERTYYTVTDNKEPIIVIEKDKEQAQVTSMLMFKHDAIPNEQKKNLDYLVLNYAINMANRMINARFKEMTQKADAPFIYAGCDNGDFLISKTKGAFSATCVGKETNILGGIEATLKEVERANRFGFTETEYKRARAEYLRGLESSYNERDKKKNGSYSNAYVRNFIDNEPIPGIEKTYAIMNQLAPSIPVTAINNIFKQMSKIGDNLVVYITTPEKEGIKYPTKQDITNLLKATTDAKLTAYVDKVSNEPLMKEAPAAGQIINEKDNTIFGTTTLTLSNGAKVIVKKTDFKADQIIMNGISFGGYSLFPDSEALNFTVANDVINLGGLGNFSAVELDKALAGKRASISASIGSRTESIGGSCSPKDLETMLQLAYLKFTANRTDKEAFKSYVNRSKAALKNQESQPMVAFVDSLKATIYGHHPRLISVKSDMVDKIDYAKIMEMYADRFKDASDFTFYFVGNIDLETAKPLFEKYLASLPSINRKETFKDNSPRLREGIISNHFTRKMEMKKKTNFLVYSGKSDYTLKNKIIGSMAAQVLDMVYTKKVREEEGGTYGVSVSPDLTKYPEPKALVQIMFDTDPAKSDKLMKIVYNEMENFAKNGPSKENLEKVRKYMIKQHRENLKTNVYWSGQLIEHKISGLDGNTDYEKILNNITGDDLKNFVNSIIIQKNQIDVSMTSKEK